MAVLAVYILMAINHLALATTANRGIVAQLTTSNAKLTTVNAKIADTQNILGEQPRTALSIIKQLAEALEAKPYGGGGHVWVSSGRGGGRGGGRGRVQLQYYMCKKDGNFWTHV